MKQTKLWIFVLLTLLVPSFAFASVPVDDITGYYKLDETSGTTASDSAGSNDGTANNARVFTSEIAGQINTGADFTQGNDRISIPISLESAYTFSVWFKTSYSGVKQNLISSTDTSTGSQGFKFRLETDGTFNTFYQDGGNYRFLTSINSYNNNEWHHAVLVLTSTKGNLYINGVLVDSISNGFSFGVNWAQNQYIASDRSEDYFNGLIDEVGIWDRALNATEIEYLYDIQKDGFESGQYPTFGVYPNFQITAINSFNQSSINIFNATINEVLYTTTNGTIITPFLTNESFLANITVVAEDFIEREYLNYNTSQSLQAELSQAGVVISAKSIISNATLTNFSVIIEGESQVINVSTESDQVFVSLNAGNYNATITKEGYYNKTKNFNISALEQKEVIITDVFNTIANVSVLLRITQTLLEDFNINISNEDFDFFRSFQTNSTNKEIPLMKNLSYNITIWGNQLINPFTEEILINESYQQVQLETRSLFDLLITFRDEITNEIVPNVEFNVYSDVYSANLSTSDGTYSLLNLTSGIYEIRYNLGNNSDYYPRSYYFITPFIDRQEVNLTLFSIEEDISATFNRIVLDRNSIAIDGYLEIQKPFVQKDNGPVIYRTVELVQVDSQGNAVFRAVPNSQQYRLRIIDSDFMIIQTQRPGFLINTIEEVIAQPEGVIYQNFINYQNVQSSLLYQPTTNITGYFVLDYMGGASGLSEVILEMTYRIGASETTTRISSTDFSGTLALPVNLSEKGVYSARAFVRINSNIFPLNTIDPIIINDIDPNFIRTIFNSVAFFILFLYLIVCATTGGFTNPIYPFIMAIAGIGAFSLIFLGLVEISITILMSLLLVAVILLFILMRQK